MSGSDSQKGAQGIHKTPCQITMRTIKKVLSNVDYSAEDLDTLRSLFAGSEFVQVDGTDTERILREVKDADVAVLDADLDERFLTGNALRWIHCNHAGLAKSARPEVFEKGILLTGSAGRSAEVLAEHAIYFMLAACYHTHELVAAQHSHTWMRTAEMPAWRGLYGRRAGIIGMGHTGKALAERLHAMGMELWSYDRFALDDAFAFVEHPITSNNPNALDALYANCDFVCITIALTDQTYRMINDEAFGKMKPGAVLVNMARGQIVDTEAMIRALDSGKLSCAGLDVTDPEPLPASSPLWDRRDVYITPHFTPAVPHRNGKCLEIIRENVRRYKAEEPMLNQVKPEDRFTK